MSHACRLLSVVGLAVLSSSARGQSSWLNPVSGSWSVPGNWLGGVPNGPAAQAVIGVSGVYTVDMNLQVQLLGLQVTDSGALLDIGNSQGLTYYGTSLTNDGVIRVNATAGGNNTFISIQDNCTLGPTVDGGYLVLNAHAGNLDTAYLHGAGGKVLTNAATHTIRGTGNVYVPLVNNGIVSADVPGRTLQLFSTNKTNNGIMQETGGGALVISGITVTQGPGGQINADTTNLNLINATISGGTVTAFGAARILPTGNLNLEGDVQTVGRMDIPNAQSVTINQTDLLHSGVITVNDTAGGNNTYLRFNQSGTVVGQAEIVLNAHPSNLDTAYLQGAAGVTLTIPSTTTVRGTGNLYIPFVNNGLVQANVNGRRLQLFSTNKTNHTTIQAFGGGDLLINGITIFQSATGLLTSDVTNLNLVNSTISGGLVSASGGAHMVINGNLNLQGGVSTSGPLDVPNGQSLTVNQQDLVHNGVVTVNTTAGGNNTYVRFNQSGTIVGPTEIALNAHPANLDTAYLQAAGGVTLTIPSTTTVRGTGNIYLPVVNNGLIHANVTGRTLQLFSANKTNNTTIKATGGGNLVVNNITLNQGASGVLTSDATNLSLVSATISGGSMSVTNGGRMVITGNLNLQGGVSTSGPLDVPNAQSLTVNQQDLIHSGVVTINTAAGVNNTNLRFNQSGTIVGPTEIVLNAHPASLDTACLQGAGGVTLTIPSTATVRGTGNIYLPVVNNGLIHANVNGRTLQLFSANKTNNATIKATGGGSLAISNITLNQGPGGEVTSEGTNLAMTSAVISGGQIEVTGGGSISVNGSLTFTGGANWFGPTSVPNAQTLVVSQASTLHSGPVTINTSAGGNQTVMRFTQTGLIDGGELVLNANPANLDTAYLQAQSGTTTLGGQETLRGRGRLYGNFVNNGVTSVGATPGAVARIDCQGNFTMGQDSVLELDVGGTAASQFDRVTCSGAVGVGGTIRVRLTDGYEPVGGETFDVVTGASRTGSYSYFDIETYPSGAKRFAVKYLLGKVQLLARGCSADFDGSGFVDTDDFTDFILAFEAGTDDADFDGTGFVDTDDFTAFVLSFEAGC